MRDTQFYAQILGVEEPWRVVGVQLQLEDGEVEVMMEHGGEGKLPCPECDAAVADYDTRERR